MSDLLLYSAYTLSFFAVLLYACRYFNEPAYGLADENADISRGLIKQLDPALPVYMTDRSRYKFYCFVFIAITEIIFLLLTRVLSSLAPTLFDGIQSTEALTPIIAASLIVGVIQLNKVDKLNSIKWVKPFIDMFKINLHMTAKIPKKGQQVYSCLLSQDLDPHSPVVKKIIEATLNNPLFLEKDETGQAYRPDLCESDFSNNRLSIQSKWARLSYLIYCVEQWETEEKYNNSLQQSTLQWATIHHQYKELVPKIVEYKQGAFDEKQQTDLNEKIELLSLKTYRLISCLLFISCNNREQPCTVLRDLGFTIFPEKYISISLNAIAKVAGAIFLAILVGAFVAGCLSFFLGAKSWLPDEDIINATKILKWVAYGVPMHLTPVIIILFAKKILSELDYWPIARPTNEAGESEETPWGIYLVVTFAGYLGATFMVIVMVLLLGTGTMLTTALIHNIFIYSLDAVVTGLFLCYRLDMSMTKDKVNQIVNFGGAILQGSLTALVMMFSFAYVENRGAFAFSQLADEDKARLVSYIIIVFFIGISIFLSSRVKLHTEVVRKYKRVAATQHIKAFFNGEDQQIKVVDVSLGGIALNGIAASINLGDVIKICFEDNQFIEGNVVDIDKNNVVHVKFASELSPQVIDGSAERSKSNQRDVATQTA
ncbi:MAG: PilZ domain-containing protein [Gammaproteobacteria bacterium]|jgi:hypothetical protein